MLLSHGANSSLTNKMGKSALDIIMGNSALKAAYEDWLRDPSNSSAKPDAAAPVANAANDTPDSKVWDINRNHY
jgi:hypothetical protein